MKFRSVMTAICVLATANLAIAAPFAYVVNSGTQNVSVIDTADNTIKATVGLPGTKPYPYSVAVGASGQYAYVGLQDTNEIAIIDTAATPQVVVKRIGLGLDSPGGLAVNAAETRLYVASNKSNTLIIIDITWTPTEVGRVAVENNPEGVVISPNGTKAYVANSMSGTVAEIALDEATNTYTRTALIPVGSSPSGLILSSDGNKLYVADVNGAAKVVDTATKVVTDLTVGSGNVTVAIRPDNSKAYAPAYSLDKLYVIDGTTNNVTVTFPTILAGEPPAPVPDPAFKGPFGSAVAPNNTLYLAMSLSDKVAVFNTTNNSFGTPIDLPPGAKPTSMGNFIGPAFTNTITATNNGASTNSGNCTILPIGTIDVNSYGRTFTITPAAGKTCDVKVDTVSVGPGQPSAYAFAYPVTGNHSIDVSEIVTGTYRTVDADWITSVGGCLVSTPAGINCASKSAKFIDGTTVTVKANTGFKATNWSGSCTGTPDGGTCTLTMGSDKIIGATVIVQPVVAGGPIYNLTKSTYHQTLTECAAAASALDVIKISTDLASLTTTGTAGLQVKMSNQWLSSDYSTKDPVFKPMVLTITDVAVVVSTVTSETLTL